MLEVCNSKSCEGESLPIQPETRQHLPYNSTRLATQALVEPFGAVAVLYAPAGAPAQAALAAVKDDVEDVFGAFLHVVDRAGPPALEVSPLLSG